MPAVPPSVLVNSILDAIQQSGGSGIYVSDTERTHPRRFVISYLDHTFSIWVYIWTLTHGGRVTLPNEYRIQMTSVDSPLPLNPDGYTALLGFHPDLGVFAGFDIQRHSVFTTGSPSVQISLDGLHGALQNGLAFTTKDNQEIAVGIRPDQFLAYILNAEDLHTHGSEGRTLTMLIRASRAEDIVQQDIEDLTEERQRVVSTINRYSRAANFRKQVLNAYENRCAVTRMQLKLIEAAHILPVAVEGSSDHISNGVALSPTMHRAYDQGLIYLDDDYFMRLNNQKADELRQQNINAGLNQITTFLDIRIHLPADINQRPNPEFIRLANRYRRIGDYR